MKNKDTYIFGGVELDAHAQRNCKMIKLKTSPTPIMMQDTSSMMNVFGVDWNWKRKFLTEEKVGGREDLGTT